MNIDELKDFLDFKSDHYENLHFLDSDPIQLPHRFDRKEDIEIVGFLVATIAWGNRKSIIKSGENLLDLMSHEPITGAKNEGGLTVPWRAAHAYFAYDSRGKMRKED